MRPTQEGRQSKDDVFRRHGLRANDDIAMPIDDLGGNRRCRVKDHDLSHPKQHERNGRDIAIHEMNVQNGRVDFLTADQRHPVCRRRDRPHNLAVGVLDGVSQIVCDKHVVLGDQNAVVTEHRNASSTLQSGAPLVRV